MLDILIQGGGGRGKCRVSLVREGLTTAPASFPMPGACLGTWQGGRAVTRSLETGAQRQLCHK